MIRVEVQVPKADVGLVREMVSILRGEPTRADAMRALLHAALAKSRDGVSVFDIFGSDLPDHFFDGVFDRDRAEARAAQV